MMFDAIVDAIETDRVTRYQITKDGSPMTYAETLNGWIHDEAFRDFFIELLSKSPFQAFRWETPALSTSSASLPFEFVLINTPSFINRSTDVKTYRNYFTNDDTDQGVVSFANLRGDATLIVPSPRTSDTAYGHLASFIRHAPSSQISAFWQIIGRTVQDRRSSTPIWLNTAGGGVAWLHVRLDTRPKYYHHAKYRDSK